MSTITSAGQAAFEAYHIKRFEWEKQTDRIREMWQYAAQAAIDFAKLPAPTDDGQGEWEYGDWVKARKAAEHGAIQGMEERRHDEHNWVPKRPHFAWVPETFYRWPKQPARPKSTPSLDAQAQRVAEWEELDGVDAQKAGWERKDCQYRASIEGNWHPCAPTGISFNHGVLYRRPIIQSTLGSPVPCPKCAEMDSKLYMETMMHAACYSLTDGAELKDIDIKFHSPAVKAVWKLKESITDLQSRLTAADARAKSAEVVAEGYHAMERKCEAMRIATAMLKDELKDEAAKAMTYNAELTTLRADKERLDKRCAELWDELRQETGARVTAEMVGNAIEKLHLGYYSKSALEKLADELNATLTEQVGALTKERDEVAKFIRHVGGETFKDCAAVLFRTKEQDESKIEEMYDTIKEQSKELSELKSRSVGGRVTAEQLCTAHNKESDSYPVGWPGWKTIADDLNTHLLPLWIPVTERMPTAADADRNGEVLWKFENGGTETLVWNIDLNDRTHWMPIPPLPTPQAEKVEDDFEKAYEQFNRQVNEIGGHVDRNTFRKWWNAALAQGRKEGE